MSQICVLNIAVPGPFRKTFDYLPLNPDDVRHLAPGIRVLVSFGQRKVIGILLGSEKITPPQKYSLKSALSYLDKEPVLDAMMLAWLKKISQYYHYPIGDTLLTALPVLLRKEKQPKLPSEKLWSAAAAGKQDSEPDFGQAHKQRAIYDFLREQNRPVSQKEIVSRFPTAAPVLKKLAQKQLIQTTEIPAPTTTVAGQAGQAPKQLTPSQQDVSAAIVAHLQEFKVALINGITGSGKTEVYIAVASKVITQGKQVLILLPEIALTPQLVARFRHRFDENIEVLHSNLNDTERYAVWENIRHQRTRILIGTRSAIFSPFPSLGLIVIDEEHDLSFKQQDGLRYSTRDIAIFRAKLGNFPVILGSATPSLESIANTRKPHYLHLHLKQRAGKAVPPRIFTLDIKGQQLVEGLSPKLIAQIKDTLGKNQQVLLFLNQRGYAPALICHHCGLVERCPRCDRNMTIHQARQRLTCHHCGYEKKLPSVCPECQHNDLRPIGYGTERIEQCLQDLFPDTDIIRIDRDTTSRKNAIHELLEKVKNDTGQILLGTQMLAKGHDFPNVTLVGILNADQGLFGADLRAEERLAQLITQVAGRAGRGDKPGKVIIQTHHPEHKLWHILINESYDTYAEQALRERRAAGLPPYRFAALFRAESPRFNQPMEFLAELRDRLQKNHQQLVEIYGPVSAPMEKRAGKFRVQLLLLSERREHLHQCLAEALEHIDKIKASSKVRWSLDVDPLDMS